MLLATPAHAQFAGWSDMPRHDAQPLGGATIAPVSGEVIQIERAKGTLIRLHRPAKTVFLANSEVADVDVKSPRLIYVFGRNPGETTLYAVDDMDEVIHSTTIRVTHDLTALRASMAMLAGEQPVWVDSYGSTLVLSGEVATAVQAESLYRMAVRFAGDENAVFNQLKVTTPHQVNLRVRVAEVSREVTKALGINWEALGSIGSVGVGLITSLPEVVDVGTSLNLSYSGSRFDVDTLIQALREENLITVLAEPNLVALSGETASFLAGGEFPIPIVQDTSGGGLTVEYRSYGISLSFTPTVLENRLINMRVRPEVSNLTSVGAVQISGFNIPAVVTRHAETTIELGSGQSFAIAGLLRSERQQDLASVPLAGEVPVLGALFRSERFRRDETELVIIVTPYLVRPVPADNVVSPIDGLTPPNDVERVLLGSTHQPGPMPAPAVPQVPGGGGLIGVAGFSIER